MPAPKKEDYRVTRGKALEAEKKRAAANPNKKVVLPSKENMRNLGNLALVASSAIPGAVVGKAIGMAAAKATAKKVGKEVLQTANKAKGSGKMVYSKAATGKKTATSPKRDVVVKTEDKTLAIKPFINRSGEKSVKVNTKKPTVRVVEKEVTRDTANMRTKQSNRLRYTNAKAEAARAREGSMKSSKKPGVGKVVGATVSVAGVNQASPLKKKSK